MKDVLLKHLIFLFALLFTVMTFAEINQQTIELSELQDSIQRVFDRKIAESKGDSCKQMDAYFEYGENLELSDNPEKSIEQFIIALRIARNSNNDAKVATIANYLANMHAGNCDINASNDVYIIGLNAAEKTGNSGEIAKISMNLASNYNYTGDYQKAIKYGLYALKIKETNNNLERICYHYIAMGNIFRENNNFDKWGEYVQKAYKMKDVEGCASVGDIAKIYNSLGGIAVQNEAFDNALLFYDTLMVFCREAEFNQGISTALTNSAGVYKQMDNYDKALELSTEAETYFGGNPYEIIFNRNFKAELYNLTGQFSKGLALVSENIKGNELSYYSTEKLKCLELLYELNVNLKNYDMAFYWNDSLRTTERHLRDEDVRQSIEDLEAKYETEKKEQKIELLTAENELKNQRLNAGIGLVVVLLIAIFLIVYILNIRKKQATLLQNDLQQQVLRAQMNPHFIFNVLGSIQNFLLQNDNNKAASYLSQFASLTRSTLENSSSEAITLSEELDMLRNYMALEKMRNPQKFGFEIEIEQDLETDFIWIPPMMIQPFIENAIKHGFPNLDQPGKIELHVSDKKQWVEFIIEDNGVGILEKQETKRHHQPMALNIFEKRRKLIQQKHKKDFKFELINLKDVSPGKSGVRIIINVPILDNN